MPHHSIQRAPEVSSGDLRATAEGTASYARRRSGEFAAGYFRATTFGPTMSSVGLGTYLGDNSDADDVSYASTVSHAIGAGINVLDTAINYRSQRSEVAVGAGIQRVLESKTAARSELVVCSKGGYIPFAGAPPATRDEYKEYVQRAFIDQQIMTADEIVAGGHCLAPRFLRYCLAKTRQNLGLRTVDVYYLHNPETQLGSVSGERFRKRLQAAFAMLEEAAARGEIGVYGMATWDGLRVSADSKSHLSLEQCVAAAREVAGDGHHFRVVQLPVNLAMCEGVREPMQTLESAQMPAVQAAVDLGLTVIGSASLMQSRLSAGLPAELHAHFPRCTTDAQRALTFARTIPGLTSALVGMKRSVHVDENLRPART